MSENNLPAVVESVPLPLEKTGKITEDEAAAACRSLGLKPIRVRRLAKSAIVGKFMSQLNAAHVGSGKLLVADKEIEKGIKLCDKFLDDYPHEPDVISSLMKVRLGLTEAMLKSAHTMIKISKDSGEVSEDRPLVPSFAPNQPVQTNVQVNIVAKENPQS